MAIIENRNPFKPRDLVLSPEHKYLPFDATLFFSLQKKILCVTFKNKCSMRACESKIVPIRQGHDQY